MLTARAAEVYEKVGDMYLKAKRFEDSVAAYKQAQARFPEGGGRLNYNLAQVCRQQGNLGQAVVYLDAYLRLQPQGLDAYELKIKLLHMLQRDAEVLPWLEQASRADPFNVGLKLLLARSFAQARQPEQAERLYLELAAKSPTGDIYRGLFRLYLDERRLGLAKGLALLNRTLTEAKKEQTGPNPAVPQAEAMIAALRDDGVVAQNLVRVAYQQLQRDDLKFSTVNLLAMLADRHKQLKEAEEFYRKGLVGATPANEALLYSGLLRVLWKTRKYDEVARVCQRGLKRSQATSPTLFYLDLARALARLGNIDQALAEVKRGLGQAADPDRFAFYLLKMRLLVLAERFDDAEKECQSLFKDFRQPGETIEIHYVLSSIYSAAHKLPQAEEQLAIVLKIDPNNATANNDLGYIWADQGKNLKEAEELIRKALDIDRRQRQNSTAADADKDNAAYIDSLGWVLFRRGQLESARDELEKACLLPDGDDPTIWDHLGDVYYRLEQLERARSTWQHALHLYERDKLRTMDQRYKELQRKYKLLDSARK
jgi:tetratricopeptide (TPR) repeat protein